MLVKTNDIIHDSNIETLSGPTISSHYILWAAVLFVLVALSWAHFAVLDEVTVGNGKVIPSSQVQIIQNLEGGIIKKVVVQEGDIVEKDQVLMYIDDTRFASSYKQAKVQAKSLEAKISRLTAESTGDELRFSVELKKNFANIARTEVELYQSRQLELETKLSTLKAQERQARSNLEELKAKQSQFERSYELVIEEYELTKPLLKDGAVSRVEVLRLERQANDLKGELDANEIAIPRAESALVEARNKINELIATFKTTAQNELATARAELAPLLESNTALEDRVKRTIVRSPVKGTIKQLYVNTMGGVIQPGADLMEIVPLDDTLLIEARIKPSDIGFIRPGQDAQVKITAYDFSIYGGLPAVVEHISADTNKNEKDEEYYEIHVRTKKNLVDNNGKQLTIIPGMMATVDILTGEKTVLNYLLKPILKAKQNALRER